MGKPLGPPPPDEIREYISYNPETGTFMWLQYQGSRTLGYEAGCIEASNGYVRVPFFGRRFQGHRLAWWFMTGEWPPEIDHINRTKTDNRFVNLRPCNRAENAAHRDMPVGKSGFRGVSRKRQSNRWYAAISRPEGTAYLGTFDTPQEAARAYDQAAIQRFGEFANLNFKESAP